ncbi:MAG TPA: LysM peptidoglycan-binding domain-containing protein, partial [bacterium]|nr:LysM peptidoglycan-binding domain-containing protein [bacterium]
RITDPINGTFKYKIKKNDSLWLLAEKYNTTVATMQSINNMRRRTKIVPGNTLLIPNPVDFKEDEVTKTSSGQIIYIIQKNDTLYEIAEKYGVSHRDIMKWNNITNHRKIKPGQKIVIPPSLSASSGQITYIIQKNDTLYEIAEKYGVSHMDIMKWNKIKNHRKIKPGQKIIIITKK